MRRWAELTLFLGVSASLSEACFSIITIWNTQKCVIRLKCVRIIVWRNYEPWDWCEMTSDEFSLGHVMYILNKELKNPFPDITNYKMCWLSCSDSNTVDERRSWVLFRPLVRWLTHQWPWLHLRFQYCCWKTDGSSFVQASAKMTDLSMAINYISGLNMAQ